MLRYGYLKALYKVFNFGKDGSCFFFISKWFYYTRLIQEFFQDEVNYSLANLKIYFLESLLGSVWVLFANDINVKIKVYILFYDFGSNCIVFIFFLYWHGCYRFWPKIVNYTPYFLFFKYNLRKVGLPWPISKSLKFLTLVVLNVFVGHSSTVSLFHQCVNRIL